MIVAIALVTGACVCLAAAILLWRGITVGAFRSPLWPPRDIRKLLAMFLLSGGGMAMTIMAWRALTITARLSKDAWPVAYALYGILALIGLVLISLGWTLGKSNISGKLGAASFDASGGDDEGDDAAAPPPGATLTATATITPGTGQ
jgi:hypothetical protein